MNVSKTKLIHPLFIKGEISQYLDRGKFTESLAELGFINQIKVSKIYDYSLVEFSGVEFSQNFTLYNSNNSPNCVLTIFAPAFLIVFSQSDPVSKNTSAPK